MTYRRHFLLLTELYLTLEVDLFILHIELWVLSESGTRQINPKIDYTYTRVFIAPVNCPSGSPKVRTRFTTAFGINYPLKSGSSDSCN